MVGLSNALGVRPPLAHGRPGVGALLSEQWYRIAALRPRLDPQVGIERVAYRGLPSAVLVLPDSQRRLRLNASAWAFVGRCDGRLTAQALWELVLKLLRDDAPTQDEMLDVLLQLHRAGALQFDQPPDFGLLAAPTSAPPEAEPVHRQSLLAIRIPLGRPDAGLTRALPFAKRLFSPSMGALWCLAMGALAMLVVSMLPTLREFVGRWLHSPHVLVMTALSFPLLKGLHELAHGLAVKRWGGAVPQWGITLMAFVPVPWVDAGAADAFAHPRHRLVVSAAGLMVELAIGAAALMLASVLQPGALRDACFVVFMTAAVSSLLVNANPLLRFDGYYALCDALELPNLAQRSQRWWMHAVQGLLGLKPPPLPAALPRERGWWWIYAPASLACRTLMAVAITLWLGSLWFWLGVSVAVYFAATLVVWPALAGLRFLWAGNVAERAARRARRRSLLVVAIACIVVGAVPVPDATIARGVVWLPDESFARAGQAGFVVEAVAHDGQPVAAGDLLFRLSDPTLPAERARLASQVMALQTERFGALADDLPKAHRLQAEIDSREASLARLDERLALLELRAQRPGVLRISREVDWLGRHVEQGAVLAHVLPDLDGDPLRGASSGAVPSTSPADATQRVRVAVDSGHVAERLGAARSARIAAAGDRPALDAVIDRRAPSAAVQRLPSAALGDRFGGAVITDPGDRDGLLAARPVIVVDLLVTAPPAASGNPHDTTALRWGERVWVRFDHGLAPLAWQWSRQVQQALLLHFAPQR